MNIQVIVQDHHLDPNINQGNTVEIREGYLAVLNQAAAEEKDLLEVPAITLFEKPSDNFQIINMIYQTIVQFQRDNPKPGQVVILCPEEATATMYRTVYNFYYAGTKAERMEDAGWD